MVKSIRGYIPTQAEQDSERARRLTRKKPARTQTGRPKLGSTLDVPVWGSDTHEDKPIVLECQITGLLEGYNEAGMYGVIGIIAAPVLGLGDQFVVLWPMSEWEPEFEGVERSESLEEIAWATKDEREEE